MIRYLSLITMLKNFLGHKNSFFFIQEILIREHTN
jgi:hypothetical protein